MTEKIHFDKPLLMVTDDTVEQVEARTGYRAPYEAELLLDEFISPEAFLKRLVNAGLIKQAVRFLANALNKREAVWWAYQVVQASGVEKAELEAAAKKSKPAGPSMAEKAAEAEAKFKSRAQAVNTVGEPEAPAASAPKSILYDPDQVKAALSRQKAPPGMARFKEAQQKMRAAMSPDQLQAFDQRVQEVHAKFLAVHGMTMESAIDQTYGEERRQMVEGSKSEAARRQTSRDSITAKSAPASVTPPTNPLKKTAPPQGSEFVDRLSSNLDDRHEMISAYVALWILEPYQEYLEDAYVLAEKLKGDPVALLGKAAFWAGENISPPHREPVPPPPGLTPRGVTIAVTLASDVPGSEKSADDRLIEYLQIGIEVATGVNTWDGQINAELQRRKVSGWSGRSGFGRKRHDD